jgi:hypothetical protein
MDSVQGASPRNVTKDSKGVSICVLRAHAGAAEREISGRILYELRNRLSASRFSLLASVTISDAGRVDLYTTALTLQKLQSSAVPVPSIGKTTV